MRIRIDEIPDAGRFLHFHWGEDRLRRFVLAGDPRAVSLVRPVAVQLEILQGTGSYPRSGFHSGITPCCLRPVPGNFHLAPGAERGSLSDSRGRAGSG